MVRGQNELKLLLMYSKIRQFQMLTWYVVSLMLDITQRKCITRIHKPQIKILWTR